MAIFPRCLFFLLSFATASAVLCPRCVQKGKASYFYKDSALSSGACAYGSMALDFNHGYLAGVSSTIYSDGAACGGCYRMRCKNKTLCKSKGTTVIVTDNHSHSSSKTDFVLSRKAYMAMARKGMGKQILEHGALDVEYKRYPCSFFNNKNLTLRVEESSKNPDYLAVKVLYQGGQTEIRNINLAPDGSLVANSLQRNHSTVWEIHNVQNWPLRFEFEVIKGKESFNIFAENVFPPDWKPGMIFDTGVQIREIRLQACPLPKCPKENW